MRTFILALALVSTPAAAQVADTSKCATIAVTKATIADIPKLQADADCFGSAAAADKAQSDALIKAAAAARASQKYRLDRIAALKAVPPPPVPSGWVPSPTLAGLPPIASSFNALAELKPFWPIRAGDDPTKWHLSSDAMHPELPKGSTLHADYFEAWDTIVKAMWTDNCIDKMLNCSGGDLGNGLQLKGAQ